MECGYAEFTIPESWLAAGWLRQSDAIDAPTGFVANGPAVVM
jgi:hypothetical protein